MSLSYTPFNIWPQLFRNSLHFIYSLKFCDWTRQMLRSGHTGIQIEEFSSAYRISARHERVKISKCYLMFVTIECKTYSNWWNKYIFFSPVELSDVREANDHFVRMRSGAFCRWPRPQAVCVKDLYPEKEFLPRCTLLHRCTETAGCCEEEGYQCGPKAMQEVVLHFYVSQLSFLMLNLYLLKIGK